MAKKRKGGFRRVARRARRRAIVAVGRARRNVANVKHELVTPGVTVATGAALGLAESKGYNLPTVGGVMPELLYGVAAAVLGTMVGATSKGTVGKVVRGAAAGAVTVAAYKLGKGESWRVGEDEDGVAGEYIED